MLGLLFVALTYSESLVEQINSYPGASWTAKEYDSQFLTRIQKGTNISLNLRDEPRTPYFEPNDIPEEFDSREVFGSSILSVRNQENCGSCWAFSISEVVGDQLGVLGCSRGLMSPQDSVSCDTVDQGCNGGEMDSAWQWLVDNGLATDQCIPYQSGSGRVPTCPNQCKDGGQIERTQIESYKFLEPSEMQEEIMKKGAISVGFVVYLDFYLYKSGVYHHLLGWKLGEHAVIIIGWGVEKGKPYWLVQNSWGENWGEKGFFKILRGKNHCKIESTVTIGYPKCL
ncbi:MAG: putative cathepsin B5 cysteine protease [Streblomastix strix]|uniref:Putative cathepsin B5 cysteine protease n=1 Tax=Streblomastix strix TaxID=222440 RepID=A0A5J4W8Z9_9EUKA|nr:MAG: putative cathepsin B5 cysteine protease [Streblomastix strix]